MSVYVCVRLMLNYSAQVLPSCFYWYIYTIHVRLLISASATNLFYIIMCVGEANS